MQAKPFLLVYPALRLQLHLADLRRLLIVPPQRDLSPQQTPLHLNRLSLPKPRNPAQNHRNPHVLSYLI